MYKVDSILTNAQKVRMEEHVNDKLSFIPTEKIKFVQAQYFHAPLVLNKWWSTTRQFPVPIAKMIKEVILHMKTHFFDAK